MAVRLDSAVQRAFAEELLQQNHLFRQNAAMQHGLPDSGSLVTIKEVVPRVTESVSTSRSTTSTTA